MTSRPVSGISHNNDAASSNAGSPRATPTLDRSETRRSTTSDSSTTSSSMKMPSLKVGSTASKRSNPSKVDKSLSRSQAATSRSSSVYSSKHGGMTSKRTFRAVEYQAHVPVLDDNGKDVTPVSLLSLKPTVLRQHTALAESASIMKDAPHSPPDQTLFETRSNLSISKSFFGSESSRTSGASSPDEDEESRSTQQSPRESPPISRANPDGPTLEYSNSMPKVVEEVRKRLTEVELESSVSLFLEETPTIWLLDIPGYVVEKETQEAAEVTAKNKKYEELLKNRIGNENFVSRGMQTFNNAQKNKDVQVSAPAAKEASTMATIWDIYDAFNVEDNGNTNGEAEGISETRTDLQRLAEFDMEPGTWIDVDNTDTSSDSIYARHKKEESTLLKAESFADNLKMIERVIGQNLHSAKLLQYRGVDKLQYSPNAGSDTLYFEQSNDNENTQKPQLQLLWKFHAPKLTNKPVQCMNWNHANKDMLAVGYGIINNPNEEGLVCVWTLGNIFHPERVFKTITAVTAVSFAATANVSLLAVGLLDGSIYIYDLRKRDNTPVLQNTEIQHHDPVWDLKWVDRGPDRGEVLVSASTDGRVLMWDIKKGLEVRSELMRLRRVPGASIAGQTKNEALIARHAGAFSVDFNVPNDPNIYLVGTEDGTIHKCSCSYNEQYLDTYRAHTGPVYKVKWSPFNAGVFISCSADWSTRIWEQEHDTPKITIESENSAFEDVCWSTFRSTMFASATNRFVQIWDIEASTLDPVASYELPVAATTVSFSPDCPALVAGDASGGVSVFRLLHIVPSQEYDQSKALLKALSPDVLQ